MSLNQNPKGSEPNKREAPKMSNTAKKGTKGTPGYHSKTSHAEERPTEARAIIDETRRLLEASSHIAVGRELGELKQRHMDALQDSPAGIDCLRGVLNHPKMADAEM
jgi:hypothetical protein